MSERVPVNLVTGWHGAGTSAVIGRLAREARPGEVAVVGTGGLDPKLAGFVVETEEETVEHAGGCGACAIRHDLIRVVLNLTVRRRRPRRIVVEVGGWSDLVVAAHTFLRDPDLRHRAEIDGIIAAVDTPSAAMRALSGQPVWPSEECGEQVAMADQVVLTSSGDATKAGVEAVRWIIDETNPLASILDEEEVHPPAMVGHRSFSLEAAADIEHVGPTSPTLPGLTTAGVVIEVAGDLDVGRMHDWVKGLHHVGSGRLLRLRGVMAVRDEDRRLLCRGAGTFVDFDEGEPWDDARRVTRLLVASRGMVAEQLRSSLQDCVCA